MRLLSFGAAAVCLSLLGAGSAQAEGGCGWGGHRGPFGGCRPNYFGGPVGYGYGYGYRPYWGGWNSWGWHRPWGWGYGWHRW